LYTVWNKEAVRASPAWPPIIPEVTDVNIGSHPEQDIIKKVVGTIACLRIIWGVLLVIGKC
jgi:hypothetical protein